MRSAAKNVPAIAAWRQWRGGGGPKRRRSRSASSAEHRQRVAAAKDRRRRRADAREVDEDRREGDRDRAREGGERGTLRQRVTNGRRVERLVDERVGVGVLRPRDRADRPALEAVERLQRRGVQRLHVGVLDLVGAVDLLGDELGVVDDLDLAGAQRARALAGRAAGRGTRRRCSSRRRSPRRPRRAPRRRASRSRRRRRPVRGCRARRRRRARRPSRGGRSPGFDARELAGHALAAAVALSRAARRRPHRRSGRGARTCGGRR